MTLRIALAGNPNCGKTTMFNKLTGSSQYVGNWPGVTVEKKEGTYVHDEGIVVTDLPGIYSLSPYSPEEMVSRDYLIGEAPDAIVNLIDSTNLERNLYLTTQILELGIPVVVALNMADLLRKEGGAIDAKELSERLGCPVVETSALRGEGLEEMMAAASDAARGKGCASHVHFDRAIERAIASVEEILQGGVSARLSRWYAVKMLEGDRPALDAVALSAEAMERIARIRADLERRFDDDAESVLIAGRYDAIERIVGAVADKPRGKTSATRAIDRILTNRWLGLPIFIAVMTLVYYIAVSTVGTTVTDWANDGLFGEGWQYTESLYIPGIPVYLESWLTAIGCAPWLQSLVLDGIVAGVGAVLGFVPQMVVLFLMLAFLEGCGYMARVAFIMDRVFRKFGLSGKSFIPMLIASGCGVPAIMATKTIENERDRRMTVMTATMIPCSAKLPIIALAFGALAGQAADDAWWVAPLFYFMAIAAIVVSGIMLRKTRMFAGEATPFVMELPRYHMPALGGMLSVMWERVRGFIAKAGTVIFLASIVIWALLNLGFEGGSFGLLDTEADGYLEHSLMALLGGALAPLFAPLGFGDWQSTATSITGLVAKENVVSTVGIMASLGDAGEGDASMWQAFSVMFAGSAPAIMAFCAFNLLCAPCFAAIGAIRRQMESAKWTWFAIGYMTAFAYATALTIYQFGTFFESGDFTVGTAAAALVLGGALFQLLRPMPDFEKRRRPIPDAVCAEAA